MKTTSDKKGSEADSREEELARYAMKASGSEPFIKMLTSKVLDEAKTTVKTNILVAVICVMLTLWLGYMKAMDFVESKFSSKLSDKLDAEFYTETQKRFSVAVSNSVTSANKMTEELQRFQIKVRIEQIAAYILISKSQDISRYLMDLPYAPFDDMLQYFTSSKLTASDYRNTCLVLRTLASRYEEHQPKWSSTLKTLLEKQFYVSEYEQLFELLETCGYERDKVVADSVWKVLENDAYPSNIKAAAMRALIKMNGSPEKERLNSLRLPDTLRPLTVALLAAWDASDAVIVDALQGGTVFIGPDKIDAKCRVLEAIAVNMFERDSWPNNSNSKQKYETAYIYFSSLLQDGASFKLQQYNHRNNRECIFIRPYHYRGNELAIPMNGLTADLLSYLLEKHIVESKCSTGSDLLSVLQLIDPIYVDSEGIVHVICLSISQLNDAGFRIDSNTDQLLELPGNAIVTINQLNGAWGGLSELSFANKDGTKTSTLFHTSKIRFNDISKAKVTLETF